MAKHLEGKVAVVTGGAGGMGSWVCKIFAEQGAKVVVADTGADLQGHMGVDPTKVNAVVDEITAAGGEATAITGDISEMDVAEKVIGTAVDTYGGLDILVCAHGIVRGRMLFNMEENDWDDVIKAHLKGCFTTTKFASMYWRDNPGRGGRIIYFSSAMGINGGAGHANYSTAQAAKIGFSRSNAQALASYGVTSNCISPNGSTRMADHFFGVDSDAPVGSDSSEGTAMDPKNIMPAIVYLASDEGAGITGRVVAVAGHRIAIYGDTKWRRSVFSKTPLWDVDTLFQEMEHMLSIEKDLGPPTYWHGTDVTMSQGTPFNVTKPEAAT